MTAWRSGEHITLRMRDRDGFPRGREPVIVVDDADDLVVTWMPQGTFFVRPRLADGRDIRAVPPASQFRLPRKYVTDRWRGPGILRLIPINEPHELILFWWPDGSFRNWYINLEWPHQRWSGGIDTRDLVLDLVIDPSRRWQWKDEDEFCAAIEAGWLNRYEAELARREGERIITMLDQWPPKRYAGWENFRPDPAWAIAEPDQKADSPAGPGSGSAR